MSHIRMKGWMLLVSSGYLATGDLLAQLNENCTISILNRNVQVKPDGTWVLPNIPANLGRVRARATCLQGGLTVFGQSDLFTIGTSSSVNVIPPVKFGVITPIPQALTLSAPTTFLSAVGATVQLTVTATNPGGSTGNVTPGSAGTDYTTSNARVATVTPDGLVTAVATGTAIITAFNEGTSGTISIKVGIAPTITITSPTSGATITEGATISVSATTTGTVAFVSVLANGQVVSTTNTAPYQFSYTVPFGALIVTLGARADDGLGNIGTAQNIQINVARDLLTTVVGKVTDTSGLPVAGATVATLLGNTAVTGPGGSFSIPTVRTAPGNISVTATFTTANGKVLASTSASITPVLGGITDVGIIGLRQFVIKVLVAGGQNNSATGSFTDTAEVYDPSTGLWMPTANRIPNAPPASITGLCAANMSLLGSGKILIAGGGCSDSSVTTNAASIYDPATNAWTPTTGMAFGRDQFGMMRLTNGNPLVFGGCAGGCSGPNRLGQSVYSVGRSSEIYDFQTASWRTVASLNTLRGGLSYGNFLQSAVRLQDGRVLACNGNDAFRISYDTCEIYDPVGDKWSAAAPIGDVGIRLPVILTNGKVLAIKHDGLGALLYDAIAGTWTSTGFLASPQPSGVLTVLASGEVLITGGSDGTNSVSTAQIYNPVMGAWRTTKPMLTARGYHIAVRLEDGRVLVAGGQGAGRTLLASAEIFDPSAETWTMTTSMSQPRALANALGIPSPDPLTTVTGRVIGADANPIGGAMVTIFGQFTATTTADGSFSIAGVPTIGRDIVAAVTGVVNGRPGGGTSFSIAPILGGTTNVGDFTLRPTGLVYVANRDSGTVSGYITNPGTGSLTAVPGSPFAAGITPNSIAMDPLGQFVFTANAGSDNVSAYTVNNTTGALTPVVGSPFAAGGNPISATVDPTGRFLYVPNFTSKNMSAYRINVPTGSLTPVVGSPFATGSSLQSAAVDSTGRFVYVTIPGSNSVSAYGINASTGALTPVPGAPFAAGLNTVAITANAGFVYATNYDSYDVSAYVINQGTGALTRFPGSSFPTGTQPGAITLHQNGGLAFVANTGGGSISGYSVNAATGVFTPLPGSPFSIGLALNTHSLTVDQTGQFLYAAASYYQTGDILGYGISANGTPTRLSSSPVPAEGTTPQSVTAGNTPNVPDLTSISCAREASLQSVSGTTAASIAFLNASAQTRNVYGLDNTGKRVLYNTLAAGASYVQATFVTNPWLITDPSGQCLNIYLPTAGLGRVLVQ